MTSSTQEAAALLWQHQRNGSVIDALPAPLRPNTHAQGHAIQAQLPGVAAAPVVGWKIAATGIAGQRHINVSGPLAGRILASFVLDAALPASLHGNRMRVAEPEFSFRLARSLAPRASAYTVAEVLAAVASLHPTLEIPDSRFADFTQAGEAQLIADDACCGRFVLGEAAPQAWRAIDLRSHAVTGQVTAIDDDSVLLERAGDGSAVLGDPRVALTWLVNELSALGITLEAGQFVSTGTCMVPLAIAPGQRVRADFGLFGPVSLAFSD